GRRGPCEETVQHDPRASARGRGDRYQRTTQKHRRARRISAPGGACLFRETLPQAGVAGGQAGAAFPGAEQVIATWGLDEAQPLRRKNCYGTVTRAPVLRAV